MFLDFVDVITHFPQNFYDDPMDYTLLNVLQLLEKLDTTADVRPVLKSVFDIEPRIERYAMKWAHAKTIEGSQLTDQYKTKIK